MQNPFQDPSSSSSSLIYSFSKGAQTRLLCDNNNENEIHESDLYSKRNNHAIMILNRSWGDKLLYLQLKAVQMQYFLACYNTMGGAYHLCDQPIKALVISQRQEILARYIGSISLLLKAKAFQATNIGLIGNPKRAKKQLTNLISVARANNLDETERFLLANLSWMNQHLLLKNENAGNNIDSC